MFNALLPGSDKYMSEDAKKVAAEWIAECGKLDWNAKCFGDEFADYVKDCKTASAFADAVEDMPPRSLPRLPRLRRITCGGLYIGSK